MIVRDLEAASHREFDLVVIGGGIYGVSLLREAARRGLSACLCEAADFGGATSWNSLRIVHGGLRYLQSLDLRRFFQSVAARRHLASLFPSLVRPLPCYMPLYGQGLRRNPIVRLALAANDVLSMHRNKGLSAGVTLPGGRVITGAEARRLLPQARANGLQGIACWHDYQMVSSERILIELLRDACRHDAVALNYCRVVEVRSEHGVVGGVRIEDLLAGSLVDIGGRVVVNCAGPWIADLLRQEAGQPDRLFSPSLAFNVVLDADLGFEGALAVAAPRPNAPVLFIVQQAGVLMAGTQHLPRLPGTREACPTSEELSSFVDLLNEALPGLNASSERVRYVLAGLLPVRDPGTVDLQLRESVIDHAAAGGPRGLHSVVGVKYTTAGAVARRVVDRLFPEALPVDDASPLPISSATPELTDLSCLLSQSAGTASAVLRQVCAEEGVVFLEDLTHRRASWMVGSSDPATVSASVAELFDQALPTRFASRV